MLTGPEGERKAFERLADVPRGWTSRNPETQREIEGVHGVATLEVTKAAPIVGPNGETWSGRGRKPRWLVEAEAANGDGA
jgi:hypothetical protein